MSGRPHASQFELNRRGRLVLISLFADVAKYQSIHSNGERPSSVIVASTCSNRSALVARWRRFEGGGFVPRGSCIASRTCGERSKMLVISHLAKEELQ